MAGNREQGRTVAEFFAGIGLMRAGLEQAGWTTVFANDIDPVKRRLYLHNFTGADGTFVLEDVHNLRAERIASVDLATASFPCTDLSLAGRRAGLQGKHSSAFWGFVSVLQRWENRKPPLILLENVAGFLTSNNGQDFHDALKALNNLGYAVDAFIVDAVHFVPQSRVRLFIVGKLSTDAQPKKNRIVPQSKLRPEKLAKFICSHPEINWSINTLLPELPLANNNLSSVIETVRRQSPLWFSKERVDYLLNQTFERHLSKVNELKTNDHYSYLTAFRRVRNGKSMAEIRFDGIAGCLRTPKGGSARQILLQVGCGEVNVRLLTPRECAKLMGAGDFRLSGTVHETLFGFGDAVCVPVVTWIANHYLNPESDKLKFKEESATIYATA